MDPTFNVQGSAALGVLAFLGTGALLAAAAIAASVLAMRGSMFAARRVGTAALGVAGVYAAALLGFSAASADRVVEPGGEKIFCEIECHLAYSVAGVERAAALGGERANGSFALVKLRVRFDPRTISPTRGDGLLYPNPRAAALVDESGHTFAPSPRGQLGLETARGAQTPLSQPLRPGESYVSTLVFEVPADVRPSRLLLTESDAVTHLLVGHENSFFHGKSAFRLPAASAVASPSADEGAS